MTMPHLMNCDHSGDGWCLDCVKELHGQAEQLLDACRDVQEVLSIAGRGAESRTYRTISNAIAAATRV